MPTPTPRRPSLPTRDATALGRFRDDTRGSALTEHGILMGIATGICLAAVLTFSGALEKIPARADSLMARATESVTPAASRPAAVPAAAPAAGTVAPASPAPAFPGPRPGEPGGVGYVGNWPPAEGAGASRTTAGVASAAGAR